MRLCENFVLICVLANKKSLERTAEEVGEKTWYNKICWYWRSAAKVGFRCLVSRSRPECNVPISVAEINLSPVRFSKIELFCHNQKNQRSSYFSRSKYFFYFIVKMFSTYRYAAQIVIKSHKIKIYITNFNMITKEGYYMFKILTTH